MIEMIPLLVKVCSRALWSERGVIFSPLETSILIAFIAASTPICLAPQQTQNVLTNLTHHALQVVCQGGMSSILTSRSTTQARCLAFFLVIYYLFDNYADFVSH